MEKLEEEIIRKRRYLTPEEKYQIFLEATMAKAKGNGSMSYSEIGSLCCESDYVVSFIYLLHSIP